MSAARRLERLEAHAATLEQMLPQDAPCPGCGLPRNRYVVIHNLRPVPAGADCEACAETRTTIRVERRIVPPLPSPEGT